MRITSHTTLITGKPGKPEAIEPGVAVDLDDEEAKDLIARGLAVRAAKIERETHPKDKPVDKDKPADPAGDGKKP